MGMSRRGCRLSLGFLRRIRLRINSTLKGTVVAALAGANSR